MGPETTLMSLADYAAWDEPEDGFVSELVRGVLVREPRPGRLHGRLQARLAHALVDWSKEAEVTTESGYLLADDPPTLRGPDVAVVVLPRGDEDHLGGWLRGAPDLAVEILSPSDTSTEVQQKTLEYLEAGAGLVWIVDPTLRAVTVFWPDGSARVLRGDETLRGDEVLSGFELPLPELFGDL